MFQTKEADSRVYVMKMWFGVKAKQQSRREEFNITGGENEVLMTPSRHVIRKMNSCEVDLMRESFLTVR